MDLKSLEKKLLEMNMYIITAPSCFHVLSLEVIMGDEGL